MISTRKIKNLIIRESTQYRAFTFLTIAVSILTLAVYYLDPDVFLRFLGTTNPILILFGAILLGFSLLTFLIYRTPFKIYQKQETKIYLIIAGIAVLFGIEVIVADIWLVHYPEDINVLFPESLLFYPAIGYIAEILFHLLPLSIFIFIFSCIRRLRISTIIWASIVLVAIMEPVYQIVFMGQTSLITVIYTGIHVFLFSLTQLIIFKRFDFISMYFFRIVFYLVWHILWGYLRLSILF